MAATIINIDAYSDALVVLGTAGIVVPLVRRFGVSPVLGYLGAGAMLGPLGLGSFMRHVPCLYWVTVVDAKNVAGIAELGVVFLLFLIGLELSYERLMTMRRLVFGLGSLQVVLSRCGDRRRRRAGRQQPAAAIIIGACLALSSTAIVIELLSNQRRLTTTAGRTSFSILLAQDLAVVPILLFVSHPRRTAPAARSSPAWRWRSRKRRWRCGVIVVVGRLLLRPLFRLVAAAGSQRAVRGGDAVRHRRHRRGRAAWPACRWRSAPSSPACCWPRPSTARPSRRRSSRSRACCSASSSSRSA